MASTSSKQNMLDIFVISLLSILLAVSALLTAINIFIPSEYGSIESCGCFGEFIHFSSKASLIKTFFIWLLSFLSL